MHKSDSVTFAPICQAYLLNDDDFNYNFGIAKCSVGHFQEGEEHLCMVQNEKVPKLW